MFLIILSSVLFASNIISWFLLNKKLSVSKNEVLNLTAKLSSLQESYNVIFNQLEGKNQALMQAYGEKSALEASLGFARNIEKERNLYLEEKEKLNRQLIQMQEKLSSQVKLEADLKLLLENAKLEITKQNREEYRLVAEYLKKAAEEKNKEAVDGLEKILAKDVTETMLKLQENLSLQQEKLLAQSKPIEFFTKILAGSKEAGSHGEQTIVNQLEQMGLKYGIDYLTQVTGKGEAGERLIADVVILIPNSGKKDILIIDSKSSTKLGSSTAEFISSVEASVNTFAGKDYKNAVERRLKEEFKDISINQTHAFIYLPFDRMLSRISEEKPEFLRKIREKDIGILTPVILDFLLDTIKLYSAKIEMNEKVESMMGDVKLLIERTARVLEFVKDLGKSVEQTSKKYAGLKASVSRMFVPAVNRMAKPLNVKSITFDDVNEENLKEVDEL